MAKESSASAQVAAAIAGDAQFSTLTTDERAVAHAAIDARIAELAATHRFGRDARRPARLGNMSGPVRPEDVPPDPDGSSRVKPPVLEITASRSAQVGRQRVRRALPRRARRTVGPWCFADHFGPATVTEDEGIDVGPHPHLGLQTVTWVVEGEILHRDSLGSEQPIRPGQLNLMTAGNGVSHAEEHPGGYRGTLHGIQLWVAQPERTRHGAPAFEHHDELPLAELDNATATVLVGELAGQTSPARRDTAQVGAELDLRSGTSSLALQPGFEHALVVLSGAVSLPGSAAGGEGGPDEPIGPGFLAYLGEGRDELALHADEATRLVLLGGEPFESEILMWWNFVARSRDEVAEARDAWQADDEDRFAPVTSRLGRIDAPGLPWSG
jgi:redox-sensitive bicupin YhaK (pirin superfamily)